MSPDPFDVIVHQCSVMQSLVARAGQVAADRGAVLIEGEIGTGKELLARAIHATSSVRTGPFEHFPCGAIPETLLESEILGHERGGCQPSSHTTRPGRFELATGGTVFLDEVGELPLSVQLKLLDVLETMTVVPVGSRTRRRVNFRVISASSTPLELAVGSGQFNRALRDRLADHVLCIPPLRERLGDLELLVAYILSNPPSWLDGPVCQDITRGALDMLLAHHWPGNVRELRNVLEAASIRAAGRRAIEVEDLEFRRATPMATQ